MEKSIDMHNLLSQCSLYELKQLVNSLTMGLNIVFCNFFQSRMKNFGLDRFRNGELLLEHLQA